MKKVLICLSILLFSMQANAFLSRGYNIEQLSSRANKIFMGEVISVKESPANIEIPYVEIKFQVFESFKGSVPAIYSFKQFAPKVGKQFKLIGMDKNSYVVGQKLIMFLGAPSPGSGLSAPEDFQLFMLQTKSRRQADIDDSVVFNKQFGEKIGESLFQNLQKTNTLRLIDKMQSKTSSGVTYKDFRNLIQASAE